ncbi:uncharacterized protein I206_102261 [Kwoniella pini CBS 10737]|uniref:Potassium ion transporter n=1 Tax=Kwoniella pini CBS 10737 TaxID=1296096 RepID=A0A1B9HT03_9TREE|nr:uncharacterized protein I206_07631 [Kwoniella pini CBS 10737]OCF46397.1 hypothetical protein I206_07631 [Kwoniella pini CBS 10737]
MESLKEEYDQKTIWGRLGHHLNFFRLHVLIFTFVPIIVACIFYGANSHASGNANSIELGRHKVTFVDGLFVCFSAMTTCGLVPINVSALHPFQQVLILILFVIGDPKFVSLMMVLVRKRYFRIHCEQLLHNDKLRRTQTIHPTKTDDALGGFVAQHTVKENMKNVRGKISAPISGHKIGNFVSDSNGREGISDSPSPMVDEEGGPLESPVNDKTSQPSTIGRSTTVIPTNPTSRAESLKAFTTALPNSASPTSVESDRTAQSPYSTRQRLRQQTRQLTLAPSQTINIASFDHPSPSRVRDATRKGTNGVPLDRIKSSPSQYPNRPPGYLHGGYKNTGMGGFPTPFELIKNHLLPASTTQKLGRPVKKLELITNPTFYQDEEKRSSSAEYHRGTGEEESWTAMVAKWMPETLSGLVIGRNSRFWTEELDDDELEQIGGVEYRALRLLGYLVGSYMLICQIIPFAIISIYLSKTHKWDSAFQATQGVQIDNVNKTWYSLFLSASSFTGTGMSLVDQGLVPFPDCYLQVWLVIFILLAGNHAFPILLRFIIWVGTRITRRGEKFETLHFLLDHPRRCFLYLFPSHQTWYLLFVVLAFMVVELLAFLVLNIGLPVLESIDRWQRFSDGFLQSLSVRASGLGIVALSNMAPSVLFLYVILMYVAIYPIAMSVRATNVYEEKALGVYEAEDPDTASKDEPEFKGKRHEVFSKYLLWHMRKQLAFDIWPLTAAIFLICCFERGKLMDPEKYDWFTIFRILFECTSAYSVIGLSLGTPNNNFSFVGELGYASKIVIILVMLRGRHRGLPVAIDRAILLPKEYSRIGKSEGEIGVNGEKPKDPNNTPTRRMTGQNGSPA